MIHKEPDSIIGQAIGNVVATVTELDDRIIREKDERCLNELKATRELLIQALRGLSVDPEE